MSQTDVPPPSSTRALRLLQGVYVLSMASTGVQVPHLASAMGALGFSAAAIGTMWGLRALCTTFSPTLWGMWADRRRDGRPLAALAMVLGAISLLGLVGATHTAYATVCFVAFGLTGTAMVALLDGLTLTALEHDAAAGGHRSFGGVRLWGSIGFGVVAWGSSELAAQGVFTPTPVPTLVTAAAFLLLAAVLLLFVPVLPKEQMRTSTQLKEAALSSSLLPFWLFAILHWASHGAYSAFVMPLAEEAGLDDAKRVVGLALAFSIVCEVGVMRAARVLLIRFSSWGLLACSVVAAVVRWGLLAQVSSSVAFILLQGLHGVTFGLVYCAAVDLIEKTVSPAVRQSAQGVFNSVYFGIGGGIGVSVAGWALDAHGPSSTWAVMAALSSASLLVLLIGKGRMQRASTVSD